MLGDFSCRVALQLLGYLWPAYQCYKSLEMKHAEILRKWCIYWCIIGLFTAVAPLADTFLWWLPLYYEAKLAFPIYLWYNNLAGAEHVYRTRLQPFIKQREPIVDRQLAEARALMGDWFSRHFSAGVRLVQLRVLAALLALQSGGQAPAPALEGTPQQDQQQQQQPSPAAGLYPRVSPSRPSSSPAAAPEVEELGRRTSSFSLDRFLSARSSGGLRSYPFVAEVSPPKKDS